MSAIVTAVAVTAYGVHEQGKANDRAAAAAERARQDAMREAERQRQEELARQARIKDGRTKIDEAFGQFNDDFYNSRSKAYVDFAMPDLDRQYQDQMKALVAALARSGTLQSSTRGEKFADLKETYDRNLLNINNAGRDYAQSSRAAVDRARGELLTQNETLADPNLIAGNATARAADLSSMPSFSPVGQLFADATAGLATQADLERRGASRFTTDLFTPAIGASGSGKVVRG